MKASLGVSFHQRCGGSPAAGESLLRANPQGMEGQGGPSLRTRPSIQFNANKRSLQEKRGPMMVMMRGFKKATQGF